MSIVTQMGGLIDCLTKHKMSDYISYAAQTLHEEYILIQDEKIWLGKHTGVISICVFYQQQIMHHPFKHFALRL